MSERSKLTYLRLMKEEAGLLREPIPNALVTREGHLNFHFCLYDLEGQYAGGYYHGLFELHENYPFAAPKLFFYTPSGRFEVSIPICTSFTNYHQETWTSAWNIRSLVLAIVSFMYSEEPSYGCITASEATRKELARDSLRFNFERIANFDKLFGEKLVQIKKITPEERAYLTGKGKQDQASSERAEASERSERVDDVEVEVHVQENPLAINDEAQERVEVEGEHEHEQPLIQKGKREHDRRRDLTRAIIKGMVIVGVVGAAYVAYRCLFP